MISKTTQQRIRERVSLIDLVREYNVALVPSGRRWKGLCPFHTEKSPSFSVDAEQQLYHCFGCHAGGDIFTFVKTIHQVDFPEAVELLARRAGVEVELEGGGGGHDRSGPRRVELYDALELAGAFYHKLLLEAPQAEGARQYLRSRGIDPELWQRFQLGYSPPTWDALLRAAGDRKLRPEVLEAAGLARRSAERGAYFDQFRGRLMFPIGDPQGRVIGFGARTLGEEGPKYINTPRTVVFDKSQVLYGLHLARTAIQRHERIGIVEGYTDVIMAHQGGLEIFVASLGTAFTSENARRLARIAPRALLIFDGDAAGQNASERSLELLIAESLDVRIYTVKDGKDPCDAIQLLGGEEFLRRVEAESVGLLEFKWRRTMEQGGESAPALRARAFDEVLQLLARMPNPVARQLHARELAERLDIPEDDLRTRLGQFQKSQRSALSGRSALVGGPSLARSAGPAGSGTVSGLQGGAMEGLASAAGLPGALSAPVAPRSADALEPDTELTELERTVLEVLVASPERASELLEAVPRSIFQNRAAARVLEALEEELRRETPSITSLAGEIEEGQARRLFFDVLERAERRRGAGPRSEGQETAGSMAEDGGWRYEELWDCLREDMDRFLKQSRLQELRRLLQRGGSCEESAAETALREEYFQIQRELKRAQ